MIDTKLLRQKILDLAIRGKLVPQDPTDEPASELLKKIKAEKDALVKAGKIKKDKHESVIVTRDKIPYEIIDGKERCIAEEVPFEIPDSWEWVRLSSICNITDGTHQTPKYVENGMPFISAQNVKPYHFIPEVHRDISYEDYLAYNKIVSPEKGDILMTRVGAGIGEAAIIDKDFRFSIYVSLTLIKCYEREYDMNYILTVLNSPLGNALAKKKTLGKGASQGNLNLCFIRDFIFPFPPLAEQHRIVAKIEELLPIINQISK